MTPNPTKESPMKRLSILATIVAVLTSITVLAPPALGHQSPSPAEQLAHPSAKRGLVFRGLVPKRSGPCAHGFQIRGQSGSGGCTHGPDPAPPGVDVRHERAVRPK